MSETRTSPIAHLTATAADEVRAVLDHPADAVKLGIKGPRLDAWAERHGIELPGAVYDTLSVGADGVLARVGGGELILECAADAPLLAQCNSALETADGDVYRLEQQSVTLVLKGDAARAALAQTCGMDLAREPVGRIAYTRVAGASCGILPQEADGRRTYRLWVDYSLASYLWETLAEIVISARMSG